MDCSTVSKGMTSPCGQLETVEIETGNGNGKRKQSKLDGNEC